MNKRQNKIFVSAYACEPGLGSEIGVGWHWVLEMSKYFELWVLTRESNRHTIEPWIAEHPEYARIHFLYFDLPKWARFWKKGLRGVRTYYNIWQFCTNRIVKQTMQSNGIKIFHHLTYGNMLWKVSSYGQKQFFVWGPVGGLETIPAEYTRQYGRKSQAIERIRRCIVRSMRFNTAFRRRCRHADLILCKTDISRKFIPEKYQKKAVLFTDVAVETQNAKPSTSVQERPDTEYIAVGRLDAWRGFDLAIESFAAAQSVKPNIHLTIVGNGPDKERLQRIIQEKKISDRITFTGKVSMETYHRLMSDADVVLNTSLKEGAVTVSFDSMAMGKPLICLDTTGYTRYFKNDYAIVIPRRTREQVIDDIKHAILRLTDRDERTSLGNKAFLAGEQFSWEKRGEDIREIITNAYLGNK